MYIHHIAITVKNLEESIQFYTKIFGFEFVSKFEKGNATFAYITLNDFQLELWQFTPTTIGSELERLDITGIRHLAFAVSNINQSVAEAKAHGVTFSEPKMGASGKRYSLGVDCNGIALELLEVS